MGFVDKSKEIFDEIDKEFEKIVECNQKTQYMQGEIKTDMRDELGEFQNYIEDLFLTFRCPYHYEDVGFASRDPGVLNKQNQPKVVVQEKAKKVKKTKFKDNYQAGDDPLTVDLF